MKKTLYKLTKPIIIDNVYYKPEETEAKTREQWQAITYERTAIILWTEYLEKV